MRACPTLMLVDDEERILRSLAMLFRGSYQVRMTTDAREALAMLDAEPAQVVISDQRMPIMSGATFLREVRQRAPHSMRLLLTGYSELDAVVASVNEGEIFRFIHKPWDAATLRETVDEAAHIALSLTAPVDPLAPDHAHRDTVLVIDDDADVMHTVKGLLGETVAVHWARSIDAAMALIDRHPIGVVVSDLVVGGEHVAGMLKGLKGQRPDIVSLVLTPFQDVSLFVGLINQGQVYRLLPKPLRRGPLGASLASALRHHHALQRAPALREAHRVEAIHDAGERTVAARVMGLLSRLRGQPVTT